MALRSKKGRKSRKDAINKASSALASPTSRRRVRKTAAETPVAMAKELVGKEMVEGKQEKTPVQKKKVMPPPVPVEEIPKELSAPVEKEATPEQKAPEKAAEEVKVQEEEPATAENVFEDLSGEDAMRSLQFSRSMNQEIHRFERKQTEDKQKKEPAEKETQKEEVKAEEKKSVEQATSEEPKAEEKSAEKEEEDERRRMTEPVKVVPEQRKKPEGKWMDTAKEYAAEIGAAALFAGTFAWAALGSTFKSFLGKAHPYVVLAAAAVVLGLLYSHVKDRMKKKDDQ